MRAFLKILFRFFLWIVTFFVLTLSIFVFVLINFDSWLIKTYARNYLQSNVVKNFTAQNEELHFTKSIKSLAINIEMDKIEMNLLDQSHISIDKCETSLSLWSFFWQNSKNNYLTCKNINVEKAEKKEDYQDLSFNIERIFDITSSIFNSKIRLTNINLDNIKIKNLQSLEYIKNVHINFLKLPHARKKIFFDIEYIQFDQNQQLSSAITIQKSLEKGENFYLNIENFPFQLIGIINPNLHQELLFFDLNSHINRKDDITNIIFDINNLQGKITNRFFYNESPYIKINHGNLEGFINSKKILKLNDIQLMVDNIRWDGDACIDLQDSTGFFNLKVLDTINSDEIFNSLPRSLSQKTLDFYQNSILQGFAKNLTINFDLKNIKTAPQLDLLNISADIVGVDFFSNEIQQNINQIDGNIHITHEKLEVDIDHGKFDTSIIKNGKVFIDYEAQLTEIAGEANVDVKSFLDKKVYNQEIRVLDAVINDYLQGNANAEFFFQFKKNKLAQQNINLIANDLTLNRPIKNLDVSNINLNLDLDNDFTKINGTALIENDTNIAFNFEKNNHHQLSVTEVNAILDLKYLEKINVLSDLKQHDIFNFSGIADVHLKIEQFKEKYILNADVDTTKADLNINVINLNDPIYQESSLKIKDMSITDQQIRGNNIFFSNAKHNFEIAFQYSLDQTGYSVRLIDSNKHNQTSLYVLWKLYNETLSINSFARLIDVENFDLNIFNFKNSRNTINTIRKIHINNNIEKFILKNGIKIDNFIINADCKDQQCNVVGIKGVVNDSNTETSFPIQSKLENEKMCLDIENAEIIFRGLNIMQNIKQGQMSICIRNEIENLHKEIRGNLHIKKFKLNKTPLAVRFLSLASLTGPLNILNKKGITFGYIDIPFIYGNKNFIIDDAFLMTNSFAISGTGLIDFNSDQIDLRGVVYPAYGINKMLVSIPFLGDLFAGDSKRRGVVGMNYNAKGNISSPEFFINPLTIFMPGFLRDFFVHAKENSKKMPKERFSEKFTRIY